MNMWGGRFAEDADEDFEAVNRSIDVDYRIAQEDIAGSRAWAKALSRVQLITGDELTDIDAALAEIAELAAEDPQALRIAAEEDIHSWVEARLIERTGDTGKKLHTGRSRNDQVATDLRLWAMSAIQRRRRELRKVMCALVELAQRESDTPFPGYTHLQRAQPILFSHWCLAYYEMFKRDDSRLADAAKRTNECPLGSAALAGTPYPIDRHTLAKDLGFSRPTANSLDAVSARDFVIEILAATTALALHLSRMAEDLLFYCSAEAGLVQLSESMTSGSSLMPQKQNPDALELLRGKSGRILGALVSMATTVKGLPLSYNKDLQEDKAALFDAQDNIALCLRVLPPLLQGVRVHRDAAATAALAGYSNATELADHLVQRGVPFREAHYQVGELVRYAVQVGKPLEDLTLAELRRHVPQAEDNVADHLTLEAMYARRNVTGATGIAQVGAAIEAAASELSSQRERSHLPQLSQLSWFSPPSPPSHLRTGRPSNTSAVADHSTPQVRPAKVADVDDLCRIVDHWAREGANLPRTRDEIIAHLPCFFVIIVGDKVLGCGSLSLYSTVLAEIRSLGLDPSCERRGLGRVLVQDMIRHARALGVAEVFVLTRVPIFFAKLGFEPVAMEALPGKVWRDCLSCPRRDACDESPMRRST